MLSVSKKCICCSLCSAGQQDVGDNRGYDKMHRPGQALLLGRAARELTGANVFLPIVPFLLSSLSTLIVRHLMVEPYRAIRNWRDCSLGDSRVVASTPQLGY